MCRFTRQLLIDLGFRRDIHSLPKSQLVDIAGTQGIAGGVVWAIGTWFPICSHIGSVIVVIGGIVYLYAHTKENL